MSKKKVLVTGGAGFVGSHLCERLSQDHELEVYSLDNYFTGSIHNHVKGVTYIEGSTEEIEHLITFTPYIIYHLGEYSRVEQSFDDMDKIWAYNKKGTFAVLEFVRKTGCKLLYAGSSTKYGDGGTGRDSSPYAWSKSSNTDLVINYGKWFDIKYAITYFYNVYGNREISSGKYATLIALFKEKMKTEGNLTVVRPGTQLRNFTHVDDIVDGLILVGKYGHGDEYGIGCPDEFSVLEVAELFGGKIEMLPERKGNRMSAEVICNKTRALGWAPKTRLIDYIKTLKQNKWSEND